MNKVRAEMYALMTKVFDAWERDDEEAYFDHLTELRLWEEEQLRMTEWDNPQEGKQ